MGRLFFSVLLAFSLALFDLPLQADITSLNSAINKAGRQRMLSQRILKTYSMLGQDINPLAAREQMQQAITLFDAQLLELEDYTPNPKVQRGLIKVRQLWEPYKQAVTAAVDRDRALPLFNLGTRLLAACHQVVLALEELSPTSAGHLVNVSGRQRMLSQRLSMLYLYETWGISNTLIRDQQAQLKDEFQSALTELSDARENSPELVRQLKKARSEWRLFRHGLDDVERKPMPFLVNLAGDKLLRTMNDITALYTDLNLERTTVAKTR